MNLPDILRITVSFLVGASIGYGFGLLQTAARLQNQVKEAGGQIKSIWRLMPGSGQRVAYLLLTLVLIQIVCPMLFSEGIQWWVSGGLLLGYGYTLTLRIVQLRRELVRR